MRQAQSWITAGRLYQACRGLGVAKRCLDLAVSYAKQRVTFGKPVIMGRKTFLSIGRPLPGRTNIVVTRDGKFQVPGVIVARSLDAALDVARGDALRRLASEIMVIGGAEIYAQWIGRADRLEVTHIHAQPDGDAFLHDLRAPDPARWDETARVPNAAGADDSAGFTYATYLRRASH